MRSLLLVAVVAACGGSSQKPKEPRGPGLYGDLYYGCKHDVYDTTCFTNHLSGTVGLPFEQKPWAECESGDWNTSVTLETGELPPGLSIDEYGTISGVPALEGNWNFSVRFSNVTCAGNTYSDSTAHVRIITTGSSTYY